VRHPYVEAGLGKDQVRAIARHLGLGDLADLPAAPCLSSRVETGLRIEGDQLAFIDAVEKYVARRLNARTVRCRIRHGEVAIELDAPGLAALSALGTDEIRDTVAGMMAREGIAKPLRFEPYRMGSAFLRPAAHG
jgi:uncharacterized protein